ncbi:hypothetical protein HDU76_006517 [Blyttiomyces sp. JEL0837]|nr:hypothetical protein HDU76_006517 [Blyttiomyces sp. JEL0837]
MSFITGSIPPPGTITDHEKEYVLVTGGAGYIGSHTVVELLNSGKNVVIVDNLSNSSTESVKEPLSYFSVNVTGTCVLLECMKLVGAKHIVFSSSATVYGHPKTMPIFENHELGPINPYGRSKYMAELVITDFMSANPGFNASLLRYFNPIGAHPTGLIGEDPSGIPNNLLPYVTQVLVGTLPHLNIFGADYDTRDGTGVRDFIHVVDLAKGHLAALDYLIRETPGCQIFNMGTGTGYSVLEIVKTMERETGLKIRYVIKERRAGDAAEVVANASRAEKVLGWKAGYKLSDMCRMAWKWQKNNPTGYPKLKKDGTVLSST